MLLPEGKMLLELKVHVEEHRPRVRERPVPVDLKHWIQLYLNLAGP